MRRVAVIGAGNMGSAMFHQMRQQVMPADLVLCDKHADKLENNQGVATFTDPTEAVRQAEVVFLAIKPQALEDFSREIGAALSDKLLISVLAGTPRSRITELTGCKKVIQAMPNLAVRLGKGVVGWVASEQVSDEEKKFVRRLFSSMGLEMEMQDEDEIDQLTAIAGSGPAYFFYLCELLGNKAEKLGFSKQDAKRLAEATCVGAGALVQSGGLSAEEWRTAVASKGGTTEAAISRLQNSSFSQEFEEAIDAAAQRAKEIT